MLRIKKLSEAIGKRVYSDDGAFFGEIEEVNIIDNKVDGWRIRVAGKAADVLGGARGVIVPNQFMKAFGDICIVSRGALPEREVEELEIQQEEIEV